MEKLSSKELMTYTGGSFITTVVRVLSRSIYIVSRVVKKVRFN